MLDKRAHDNTRKGLVFSPRIRLCGGGVLLIGFAGLLILGACANAMEDIRELSQLERAPMVSVDSLRLEYTVRGKLNATVHAPLMVSYDRANMKYDEFPGGIEVRAYDDAGAVKSMIRSNYALYLRDEKLWDARFDVVAVNEAGDSIETEQIFWNELTGRVYTTANVRVRTPRATLFGRGFESDDRFESWEIKEPTGVISVVRGSVRDSAVVERMAGQPMQ